MTENRDRFLGSAMYAELSHLVAHEINEVHGVFFQITHSLFINDTCHI
jgi:hypothetical protein